jgi:4-hydroxybenzoate polyprenyltransferase
MSGYLLIYRPLNILFIALAQWLTAYFLDTHNTFLMVAEGGIYWLMIGTAACTAFGYWVNDFTDYQRDSINRSELSAIHKLDNKLVYIHFLAFISLTLYAGTILGIWFSGLFLITIAALVLYSKWLKNVAIVGNFTIASLSFLSLFSVYQLFPSLNTQLILHFASLAAVLNLVREMVKDAEDVDGDDQTGAKTMPVIWGVSVTNISVYGILLVTISFTMVSVYFQSYFFESTLKYVYYAYYLLFIALPLYKIAVDIRYARTKEEYTELSTLLKYVLGVGILSMLFF